MNRSLASLVAFVRLTFGLPPAGPSSPAEMIGAAGRLLLALLRCVVAPSRCAACDGPAEPARVIDVVTFCRACARSVERPARGVEVRSNHVAFAFYGGAVAEAVRRFKYGPRPDLAHPLGELLRQAVHEAGLRADVVVPVPLHPARLRERGFNQAALLAAAVASGLGAPLAARALVRVRATRAQASLGRAGRLTNLEGAVRVRSPASLRGRHVLIVDDVRTTGSTLEACRAAVLAAGARRVTTLVLAEREIGGAPPRADIGRTSRRTNDG